MKSINKHLLVINDGVKIRPDWTDRIVVSYMPKASNNPLMAQLGLNLNILPVQGDFSGTTLNGVVSGECGRAWEVRDSDGVLDLNEPFSEFVTPIAGRYNFRAYTTLALNPSEIRFFKGNDQRTLVGIWTAVGGFTPFGDHQIHIEVNEDYVWANEQVGYVDFQHNVYYISGSLDPITLGNNQSFHIYNDSILYNLDPIKFERWGRHFPGNRMKGFLVELGCYINLTDDDTPNPVTFADLTADAFVPKSGYCLAQKVASGGDFYVDLIYGKKNIMIKMGEVWNKPEWTNDYNGQNIAFNEISEWIISGS